MITAVVLAGGYIKEINTPKSLVKFREKTLIERIIDSLSKSRFIKEIVLIAGEDGVSALTEEQKRNLVAVVPAGEDLIEKIFEALDKVSGEMVLLIPVDIPFVDEKVIDGFIEECLQEEADAYYPIIRKETIEKVFPETKRTYGKLKDGTFTGGNLFLVKKDLFYKNRRFIEEIYDARKNAYKMAKVAGFKVFLKGIFGVLKIKDAEKRVSRLFDNARMKAVETRFPEIGIDVDKVADIEFLKKYEEEKIRA